MCTHHVCAEWLQEHGQEALAGEEGPLVQLLSAQVKVVVHGLHEGAQEVDAGVADAVIFTPQSPHHLLTNNLTHAVHCKKKKEKGEQNH